jgi:hypothetical protein
MMGRPTILQYSLNRFNPYPEFKPSILIFLEANQIRYYSVATPVTNYILKRTSVKDNL